MATTKAFELGDLGTELVVNADGTVSSLDVNTDSIAEGSSNLYHTTARARASISVSGNLTYDSSTGVLGFVMPTTIASLSNHDTDDLTEGTANLYFTSARARASLTGGTGITYSSSTGQIEITNTAVTAGSYGSASQVPVITVNAQGQITSASTTAVAGVSSTAYDTSTGVLTINTSDGGSFTEDLGVGTADSPTFTGLTTTADITFGDNDKAIFGAGSDLEIFHDGSHSVIQDVGTGRMFIKSNGTDISLSSTSDIMVKAIVDGAVQLYYDNSLKLATTSTGVDVTGNITLSGTVDGRDVAADGTKLDGIESGATADQTASEILTLIKTVDGAGSGLDADTLDGYNSDAFVAVTGDTMTGSLVLGANPSNAGSLFLHDTSTTSYTLNIKGNGTRRFDFIGSGSSADFYSKFTQGGTGLYHLEVEGNLYSDNNLVAYGGNLYLGSDSISANVSAYGDTLNLIVDNNNNSGGTPNITFKDYTSTILTSQAGKLYVPAGASYNPDHNIGLTFSGAGIAPFNFNPAGSGSYKSLSLFATGWDGSNIVTRNVLNVGNYYGYVGIGPNAVHPDCSLHIHHDENRSAQIKLESSSTSAVNGIFWQDEIGVSQTEFKYDHTSNKHELHVNGNGFRIYSKQTSSDIAYIGGSGGAGGYNNSYFAGDVGIGDSTPSYKLDVNGTIRATGDVIADSDVRLKSDIQTITNAVDTVKALRGTTYIKDGKASIGVIAQEIEEVLPQVVSTADDEMGTKSVAYGNIVAVLIEAIKEQQEQIDELKKLLEAK